MLFRMQCYARTKTMLPRWMDDVTLDDSICIDHCSETLVWGVRSSFGIVTMEVITRPPIHGSFV